MHGSAGPTSKLAAGFASYWDRAASAGHSRCAGLCTDRAKSPLHCKKQPALRHALCLQECSQACTMYTGGSARSRDRTEQPVLGRHWRYNATL